MKRFITIICCVLSFFRMHAQNVAINSTGAAPNASAMLHVAAANKGILIPQVTLTSSTDAVTIATPATSLLVYNLSTSTANGLKGTGYYYNSGTAASPVWVRLVNSVNSYADTLQVWLLKGNSNTDTSLNFLGTKNNMPMRFKLNNTWAGQWDISKGNYFIGNNAGIRNTGGVTNIGYGDFSLAANTTGTSNTGIGERSLFSNISGDDNVAVGDSTLLANTTGDYNVAIGKYALQSNISGSSNIAIGTNALDNNIAGTNNIAIGANALGANRYASGNIAIGKNALNALTYTNGANAVYTSNNIAIGDSAMLNTNPANITINTSGKINVAIGVNAMRTNTTGFANTCVGVNSNISLATASNSSAFGYNAVATASNYVRIGNTAVTVINGAVNFTTSDGRFKNNVQPNVPGLDFILKLRPVTYHFEKLKFSRFVGEVQDAPYVQELERQDALNKTSTGFIAQEVEATANAIHYDFDGVYKPQNDKDTYGIAYQQFVPSLVKAVQEQNAMIQQQLQELKAQQPLIDELVKKITELEKK